MKNTIIKLLPIALGVALGWFIFQPPGWIESLGIASPLVIALVVFVVLIVFIVWHLNSNLPADLQLEPFLGPLSDDMTELIARFQCLGFVPAETPWIAGMKPPAIVVGLVHPDHPIIAAVYRTGTVPSVMAFDFVSVFHGQSGGLTTGSDRRGGSLPAGPTSFRQLFHGAEPADLLEHHRLALAWLEGKGLVFQKVAVSEFPHMMRQGIALQRCEFLAAPVRFALIVLWRATTSRNPHLVPINAQRGVEAQVERLARGG